MQSLTLTHVNSGVTTSVFNWNLLLHQNFLDTDGDGTADFMTLKVMVMVVQMLLKQVLRTAILYLTVFWELLL